MRQSLEAGSSRPTRHPALGTSAAQGASSAWQRLYAAAHSWRQGYWADRAERLSRPVWSIGNLHWGGTGKTPLVAAVAARLRDGGQRVAILSRGYHRRGRTPLLVSDGGGPRVPPERAGDEAWLLASELPGVAVAVAARRADAGRLVPAGVTDIYLLDDGFSHLALHRDLDLLALPADDPLGGGRLLPGGRLREPLAAVARAHALLLTGAGATPELALEVADELASWGFTGPAFACPSKPQPPRLLAGGEPPADAPLLLVTGVARPERVRAAAERLGLPIAGHLAFSDHHRYPPRSLRRIERQRRRLGAAAVLTTSKDRGKLVGRLIGPLLELPLVVEPDPTLWSWLAAQGADQLGEAASPAV